MRPNIRNRAAGGSRMESVIKCKMLSYGLVEVRDAGATSPRYRLYVAGQLKSYSDDLYTILAEFDRLY
jgi:hypothetical protein